MRPEVDPATDPAQAAPAGPRFARTDVAALEARRFELLAELHRLGNPGLVSRWLRGRRRRSIADHLNGREGSDRPVRCESAWPIGLFTWRHDGAHPEFELLATGYTTTGRFVPLRVPAATDPVEPGYGDRTLAGTGPAGVIVREPRVEHVVAALEAALAMHRRAARASAVLDDLDLVAVRAEQGRRPVDG